MTKHTGILVITWKDYEGRGFDIVKHAVCVQFAEEIDEVIN